MMTLLFARIVHPKNDDDIICQNCLLAKLARHSYHAAPCWTTCNCLMHHHLHEHYTNTNYHIIFLIKRPDSPAVFGLKLGSDDRRKDEEISQDSNGCLDHLIISLNQSVLI